MNLRILVIDDDEDALLLLKLILQPYGYQIMSIQDISQAVNTVRRKNPDLIILEPAIQNGEGFDLCRRLRMTPGGHARPILMLSRLGQSEEIVRGLEAGASAYLVKPPDPSELVARIQALLRQHQVLRPMVVVVMGAKPGVGATMIAVNLGVALAYHWQEKVVLLDAEIPGGDSSFHLGLQPAHSVADLISYGNEVDKELIEGVICHHDSGLQVIAAPAEAPSQPVPPGFLTPIIHAMTGQQKYVIVDSPPVAGKRLSELVRAADQMLLVAVPELPALQRAARLAEAISRENHQVAMQLCLVLNQADREGGIPVSDLPPALQEYPLIELPFDAPRVLTSINVGKPLVLYAPNCKLARKLVQMAQEIRTPAMETHAEPEPESKGAGVKGLLDRLRRASP